MSDAVEGEGDATAADDGDAGGDLDQRSVARDTIDATWTDWFPVDPYPQQVDGVERALRTLTDGGYLAMEGACGTGKTLIALAAGLEAIRAGHGDRLLAVTPVKQQLRQFVTEIRAINRDGAPPARLDGLVLVGKRDLLPYAREGRPPYDERVQEAASEAREVVTELVRRDSTVPLDVAPGDLDGRVTACEAEGCARPAFDAPRCPDHQESDEAAPWYDPVRAAAVCRLVAALPGDRLATAGVTAPYPSEVPHARDVVDLDRADALPGDARGFLDPFYARFLADEAWPRVSFDDGEAGVLDSEALVRAAASAGTCPHEVMAALAADADVLVGNYNHAFDPMTRLLTGEKAGVLGTDTLLIVDEAHMLEDRVRDLLSESVGLTTLRTARQDVQLAIEYCSGTGGAPDADPALHRRDARTVLDERDLPEEALQAAARFLDWLLDAIDDEVTDQLEAEYGDWQRRFAEGSLPEVDHAIALRDPETPAPDRLTERAIEDLGAEAWRVAAAGCSGAAAIHEHDSQTDRTPRADAVGGFLDAWFQADHAAHLRLVELTYAESAAATDLPDWAGAYNAGLTLYNCLPREPLARTFDEFGGGVLMSATLEPFDVYREVSGLAALAADDDDGNGDDDGDGTTERGAAPATADPDAPAADGRGGRRVDTARYGLAFPEANRASWVVDLPAFTYRNRGAPVTDFDEMTPTRAAHAGAIATTARSPGNVLLCLPSYAEAEWAVALLREQVGVDKPVLRDRSSTRDVTDAMLGRFFQGDGVDRVLVTSARGTVTEGIDYDGDKLHTVAVVGVPYANTATPRTEATIAAYDRAFDDRGFEYAVRVPAVRKARQALGRVIRGPDERGTRLLLDRRYRTDAPRSVRRYLADWERGEFSTVSPDMLEVAFDRFWTTD